MVPDLRKIPPITISAELSLTDVVNTTPPWHDNVTEALQPPEGCLVIPLSVMSLDNPETLVTQETHQQFKKFVNAYFLWLCFLVSAPTNLINMAVFWKHGIKERINLCLFCLSFADLIVIVFQFLTYADMIYAAISRTVYKAVLIQYLTGNMIIYLPAGFISLPGFLSTLIAFERCLCVVSTLKAQNVIQIKTIAVVIATGHVAILAGTYFLVARFRFVCIFDPFTGKSKDGLYHSEFYLKNRELVDIFVGIVYGIGLPGVYTFSISICTIITVVKLRRMAEWRKQSSSSASLSRGMGAVKDATLTRMLVGTSCVFVVCITPQFLFHTIIPLEPQLTFGGKYHNTYRLLIVALQMCVYVNSTVNFFVCYSFGTRYRQTVRGMFCGWRRNWNRVRMTAGTEFTTDITISTVTE